MVGRPVTSNSPTRGVQIGYQIAAHRGSQQSISSNTGNHRPNAFNAGSKHNMSGTGMTGPKWGCEHILTRTGQRIRIRVNEFQPPVDVGSLVSRQQPSMIYQTTDSQKASRNQTTELTKIV